MTPASEHELALSMTRLWGKDARHLARIYALDCWRKGDAAGYNRWHCVERIVEQAQATPHRSGQGVHHTALKQTAALGNVAHHPDDMG